MAQPPKRDREVDSLAATVTSVAEDSAQDASRALSPDFPERYTPGRVLGAGGMGEVRLFTDTRIDREVAVKRIHAAKTDDPEGVQRFVREASIQGRLEHPSIVPVYDVGVTAQGDPYMTMRRVQGMTLEDLRERLADGDESLRAVWTRRRLLTAFSACCQTVHYAHTRGVVHRDLKPANIMLGEFGEVYVLDWGVAKLMDNPRADLAVPDAAAAVADHDEHALTQSGRILGTPRYMAPEQYLAESETMGPGTDVYALGLILYELLTLQVFNADRGVAEIYRRTIRGVDVKPSDVVRDTPPELDAICQHATRRAIGDRTASAKDVAEQVERFLDGDRDLARRRELAGAHVERAQELAALARGQSGAENEQAHKKALREVVAAIALDPSSRDARRTLVRLVAETSNELPPSVEHEWHARRDDQRRTAMRSGFWGWMTWCITIPVALTLGVRQVRLFVGASALIGIGALYVGWLSRKRSMSTLDAALFATLSGVLVASFSAWLGPFVLVPLAAMAVLFFTAAHATPRERAALIAVMLLAILVPFAIERAGLVAPSMVFRDGNLVFLPRAFEIRPVPTLIAFLWASVGFAIAPTVLVGRVRDALNAAERRLLMQSWQLRQFAED